MNPFLLSLPLAALIGVMLTSALTPSHTLASPAHTVVRNTRLGVSLTLPRGWFLKSDKQEPPCEMYFVSGPKMGLDLHQRLGIRLVGRTYTRDETLAARHAATTFIRRSVGDSARLRVRRTFTELAGTPAVRLMGVPSNVPNVVFIVVHGGVIYAIETLESSVVQPDQQRALASLRFIPRSGNMPSC
jgi:hypothetical protein